MKEPVNQGLRLLYRHRVFAVEGWGKNHKGNRGFASGINEVVDGATGDIKYRPLTYRGDDSPLSSNLHP
jgi:hypothetical protein